VARNETAFPLWKATESRIIIAIIAIIINIIIIIIKSTQVRLTLQNTCTGKVINASAMKMLRLL